MNEAVKMQLFQDKRDINQPLKSTLPPSIFNEEILKPSVDLPDIGYAHLAGNKLKIIISKSQEEFEPSKPYFKPKNKLNVRGGSHESISLYPPKFKDYEPRKYSFGLNGLKLKDIKRQLKTSRTNADLPKLRIRQDTS